MIVQESINILESKHNVKNKTNFNVKLLGVTVFSINSRGTEEYIGDQLISFNSETFQNNKRKYVNLIFDEKKEKFVIAPIRYQYYQFFFLTII